MGFKTRSAIQPLDFHKTDVINPVGAYASIDGLGTVSNSNVSKQRG
jgi:hypothetical protein